MSFSFVFSTQNLLSIKFELTCSKNLLMIKQLTHETSNTEQTNFLCSISVGFIALVFICFTAIQCYLKEFGQNMKSVSLKQGPNPYTFLETWLMQQCLLNSFSSNAYIESQNSRTIISVRYIFLKCRRSTPAPDIQRKSH